ncbi:MAG TPA: FAD-dependent oxidoreductase [Steroidobacteraceae bacterium]|nr:FAD-dependent oxidoreductase [Steroidobacteraceae bacterium]
MPGDYDAIVIGAGPAGCTAAILLAQGGWSVALVEKQPFPRRKVCGECIAATNLPLLDALGVGEEFSRLAGPALRRVALMCATRTVSAPLPARRDSRHPWGRALGRESLDTLLLQRARTLGACVLQPATAQRLAGGPGAFRCEVSVAADGQELTLRAPVAIAAHGSWQPLPTERARWRAARRASDLLAFKANFSGVRLEEGVLPVLSLRGGYGGLVVADRGVATVACCIREDRLAACRRAAPGQSAGAVVESYLQQQCLGVRRALADASLLHPWIASGPVRPGVRLSAKSEGAFLVGNAAGEAHPIIGEGISMAMQSAWLLCRQLLRFPDVLQPCAQARSRQREIHQQYAAQWRAQFQARMRLASLFGHLAMRPAIAARMFPLLQGLPGLLTQSARWSGKIRGLANPGV